MLKPNQKAKVKWCSRNKNRLVGLGYNFIKMGDEIEVEVEHLSHGSPSKIIYICDYCGKEVEISYMTYTQFHKHIDKDACKNCASLKSQEAFMKIHGVTNPLQVPEINKKQRETCKERYDVEYALQNKDLLEKKNQTCINRYGTSSVLLNEEIYKKKERTCIDIYGCRVPSQNAEVLEKIKQTNIKRYGCPSVFQNKDVRLKIRNTMMRKYGVMYSLQYPEFAKKAKESCMKTLFKHGNIATSKPQIKIYHLCQEIYGKENVILNKPEGIYALDVAIEYKGFMIDLEYDCLYWHQSMIKDIKRDNFVGSRGYKILRILTMKETPSKEQIKSAIEYLTEYNHNEAKIILDV